MHEARGNHGSAMIARVREDRLLRWSAYAAVPVLWLAIALFNPVLLLVPPLTTLALWTLMRRGIVGRHDPVVDDDPDFF
jgi:hypothetical protein